MAGACRRGRPCTASMDMKTWTGLTIEELTQMAEDRDKYRKYLHGVLCGHYCIYCCMLRNCGITVREIVYSLSTHTAFNSALVHVFAYYHSNY